MKQVTLIFCPLEEDYIYADECYGCEYKMLSGAYLCSLKDENT